MNSAQRQRVPVLILLVAFSAALAPPSEGAPSWTSLPLIQGGNVHPDWGHTGWGQFTVENGALRTDCSPKGMGLLVYKKERFGNCQIRVVFKAQEPRSNAGVYIRIDDGILPELGKNGVAFERDASGNPTPKSLNQVKQAAEQGEGPWYAVHHGYEVQIAGSADSWHRTGAIYSLAPSSADPGKNTDQWQTMIITLDGTKVLVDLDGRRVTEFDSTADDLPPRKQWHEPIRKAQRPAVGYIGLQNHDVGDVVWFKEVSVRPLAKKD